MKTFHYYEILFQNTRCWDAKGITIAEFQAFMAMAIDVSPP
jgi:hypothetical protein